MLKKVVGADPLLVSPINPLDYKMVNGVWIHEPGWYKKIADKPRLREEKQEPKRGNRRK